MVEKNEVKKEAEAKEEKDQNGGGHVHGKEDWIYQMKFVLQ